MAWICVILRQWHSMIPGFYLLQESILRARVLRLKCFAVLMGVWIGRKYQQEFPILLYKLFITSHKAILLLAPMLDYLSFIRERAFGCPLPGIRKTPIFNPWPWVLEACYTPEPLVAAFSEILKF